MTREEFTDLVYDELCDDDDNCRANRIIDAADDYTHTEWISVKERLPTKDGEYLTTVKSYGFNKPYVTMLNYANKFTSYMLEDTRCNSGWYRYSSEWGYVVDNNVLAWQELPKPYKENHKR